MQNLFSNSYGLENILDQFETVKCQGHNQNGSSFYMTHDKVNDKIAIYINKPSLLYVNQPHGQQRIIDVDMCKL